MKSSASFQNQLVSSVDLVTRWRQSFSPCWVMKSAARHFRNSPVGFQITSVMVVLIEPNLMKSQKVVKPPRERTRIQETTDSGQRRALVIARDHPSAHSIGCFG